MNDPKISEALERNFSLAASLGIDGTPAYIVGGQIIPGAVDSEALAKFVLGERARVVAVKEKSAIQN